MSSTEIASLANLSFTLIAVPLAWYAYRSKRSLLYGKRSMLVLGHLLALGALAFMYPVVARHRRWHTHFDQSRVEQLFAGSGSQLATGRSVVLGERYLITLPAGFRYVVPESGSILLAAQRDHCRVLVSVSDIVAPPLEMLEALLESQNKPGAEQLVIMHPKLDPDGWSTADYSRAVPGGVIHVRPHFRNFQNDQVNLTLICAASEYSGDLFQSIASSFH